MTRDRARWGGRALIAVCFGLSSGAACGGGVSPSPVAAAGAGGDAETASGGAASSNDSAGAGQAGQAACACPPGDYFVTAEGTWSGQRIVTLRNNGGLQEPEVLDCERSVVLGMMRSCSGPPVLDFAANTGADSIEVKQNGVTYGDGEDYGYGELVPTSVDVSVAGVISGKYTAALEVPYQGGGGADPGSERVEISGTFRLCRRGGPTCP